MTSGMSRRCLLVGLGLILFLVSLPALAEKRIALVIGNSAYVKTATLPNPKNDALAIASLLRNAGFDVVDVKTDLGAEGMRRAMRDFSVQALDADIAVVFYAGHGMEMNGVNYLIPIDATIVSDVDVEDETVSLDRVIRTIEPARHLQLIILDACRANPFVRSMRRTIADRAVRSGHADIDEKALPPNMMIGYAQKAGLTAEDGNGADSPYTTALLKHLATPGLDIELALRRVRDEVLKATRNRQEPFKYGSLGGSELPLVPAATSPVAPASTAAAPTTPQKLSEAAEVWDRTKDTTSIAALELFIASYKDTYYAGLARLRLEELKHKVALAVPPAGPPTEALTPCQATFDVHRSWETGIEITVGPKDRRCFIPGGGKTQHFKDCPECPEMVVVPADSFTMGSPADEPERSGSEAQVGVSIAKPFAVGRFAVTFDEWDACAADGGCNGYKPSDQGWGRGKYPVINVNWDDAKAYASWLSRKTGKTYRLLSETEREYVTRAGTTTSFWWGSSITPKQANYQSGANPYKGGVRGRTVPVDSFEPNPWGLYNVHGNVFDWTEDCMNDSNTGNPGDGRARTTDACTQRVLRGGSWFNTAKYLRSAFRGRDAAVKRGDYLGFRLARTLHP